RASHWDDQGRAWRRSPVKVGTREDPLAVIVVDDSATCREVLRTLIEADGDIVVTATAADAARAREVLASSRADLVTMDITLPDESGLSVIEWVMARQPLPILVLTSAPTGAGASVVFDAVRRGALEVMA